MDLPLHNLELVARTVVTPDIQISSKTLDLLRQCCAEFLAVVAGSAADAVKLEGRKCVTMEDILEALANLDLDHYSPCLRLYLSSLSCRLI